MSNKEWLKVSDGLQWKLMMIKFLIVFVTNGLCRMNSINLPVFLPFLESVWLWYPFTFVSVVIELPTDDQLEFSFEIGKETCCKSFVNFIISFQIFRNLCWLRSITWLRHFWCHYWICNYSGLDFFLYQNISFYLILDLTDFINSKDFYGNLNRYCHLGIYWNRFWVTQVGFQDDCALSLKVRESPTSACNPVTVRDQILRWNLQRFQIDQCQIRILIHTFNWLKN